MIRAAMKVRAATPADIPAIMTLAQQDATAAHWTSQEYLKIFKSDLLVQRYGLVGEENGEILGFAIARELQIQPVPESEPEWELENLAVAPAARRRGIATRLLDELLRMALDHGATNILLEARESNQAARALYRKWGAVESGRRPGYYQNPEESAVLYKLSSSRRPKNHLK